MDMDEEGCGGAVEGRSLDRKPTVALRADQIP
jgi:hypothetical protein